MRNWRLLALVAATVLAVSGVLMLRHLFGEHETASVESVSPDGMFRCTVTERASTGQCRSEIVLYSRQGTSGFWTETNRRSVQNDSACRSNYSVDWDYDEKHRTTGLKVFGDFGSPPFPGEVLLDIRIGR